MTAGRLEPEQRLPDRSGELRDRDREDFLSRTLPLPAIDIAGFEARSASVYEDTTRAPRDAAGQAGLEGVARGGAINLVGAIVSAAASVGLTVVVTRSFHKSAVGTFFVAMSLFLIVEAITNLGAYNGAIYFIARLRALNAERRIPAIMRATIVPVLISSVIGAAALIAFVHPLARLLLHHGFSAARPGALATALRVLAVALPFAALADTMLGATRGYHEMRPTVFVDRIGRSTLQLLGVAAAALAGSSALLAPLWALPYLPVTVVAALWLRRIMRRQRPQVIANGAGAGQPRPAPPVSAPPASAPPASAPPAPAPPASAPPLYAPPVSAPPASAPPEATQPTAALRSPQLRLAHGSPVDNRHGKPNARGFWKFTAPRSLASVAQIVIQRLDIVLVGIIRGPAEAAIYTAATRFLVAGQLGNAAISMAAQPQLTRLFAVRDRVGANTVYQVTTAWLILLTWPLYLLAAVFGPSVLRIFGHSYQGGSTVMVILALAMLVATACGQVDMVLITTGRSSWSLYNGLLAMGVNIGVDLALIKPLGITGAAIGWAAAIGITNLVPLAQVAATERVHPFGRGMASACALTLVSFAAIPLGLRALAGTGPIASIAAVVLGCAVMAVGLWQLHSTLHLSAMPGLDRLAGFARPGRRANRS